MKLFSSKLETASLAFFGSRELVPSKRAYEKSMGAIYAAVAQKAPAVWRIAIRDDTSRGSEPTFDNWVIQPLMRVKGITFLSIINHRYEGLNEKVALATWPKMDSFRMQAWNKAFTKLRTLNAMARGLLLETLSRSTQYLACSASLGTILFSLEL